MAEMIGALLLKLSGGRIVTRAARAEMNKAAARWAAKCQRIQWELDDEHRKRFGWENN